MAPHIDIFINTKPAEETSGLFDELRQLVLHLGGGFRHSPILKVMRVEGGISNLLFKVEAGPKCDAVIVRVFGGSKNPDLEVCNRSLETRIYTELFDRGFGPGVLATFSNGRIERFFYNCETLKPLDMLSSTSEKPPLKISSLIAKEIRRFHETQLPCLCGYHQHWNMI